MKRTPPAAVLPLLAAALWIAGTAPAAAESEAPVVVELFTSQGCSSCPPADALAGRLAQRDDLLVLSFHVNYWDYIGWEDPFATEETTARQHAYARSLGLGHVYTPQMVIGGAAHAVGSDDAAVREAIAAAAAAARVPVEVVALGDGTFRIGLPASDAPVDGEVLMLLFDRSHETRVARGENRGRTLVNHNVVRTLVPLGRWDGTPTSFEIAPFATTRPGERCAVLVQARDGGRILGAAKVVD